MNVLKLGDNDLIPVDYSDLLEKLLEVLQRLNPFSLSRSDRQLLVDVDAVAAQLATLPLQHPLGSLERFADVATINFTPEFKQKFPDYIGQIKSRLQQYLQSVLGESIEEYVARSSVSLESEVFQGSGEQLGFKYAFQQRYANLEKQKLTLEGVGSGSHSLLKLHKLTIAVRNADRFQEELREGIAGYIEAEVDRKDDREELHHLLQEMVETETSDFHRAIRIVDRETLGKLKREAKIIYLEYLLENIQKSQQTRPEIVYLQDLIRRLHLIEEYISDRYKSDGHYSVNYDGVEVNYRDLFSRSEVLDALPIIPIIAGFLGETSDRDRGERKYIFGLKLKFDNPVQSLSGEDVFEYNLALLNPDSKEHQAELADPSNHETFIRKVLKLAFLYYFVFASNANPLDKNYQLDLELGYDPIASFETLFLAPFQGTDEKKKQSCLRGFVKGLQTYQIKVKIDRLKELLKDFLDRQTILPAYRVTRHLRIKRGILEQVDNILTTGKFFKDVLNTNPKQTLQYIEVGQPQIDDRALCQLPVNFAIEDIRYFQTDESQQFSLEYNSEGIQALPVVIVPRGDRARNAYKDRFKHSLVLVPYENRRLDREGLSTIAAFVYQFTFSLLLYLCFLILLEKTSKRLFIPTIRLHEGDREYPSPSEKFVAHVSKAISHLLSEKHRSCSQGFRIRKMPQRYSIRNGLTSLYSILPKKFRLGKGLELGELDKLAIVIVSSRESDVRKGNPNRSQRKANLLGEVIGINRLLDDSIQIERLQTFSENYTVSQLYNDPPILADIISQLERQGYQHFLYIAQAPYSSTLHITQTDEDRDLFFLSKNLIRTLKGDREGIKIYPVFFDKYYVRIPDKMPRRSFYIQDIKELESRMFQDSSHQAVMFFNLCNGIKVKQADKNFYNGVITYSTLLNIYQGVLDDRDIREGLLYDNPLKETLLNYLTFFHFSRYEARPNIHLKLDPYDKIIGEESIGALSLFNHIEGRAEFNILAFLTEVRKVFSICS